MPKISIIYRLAIAAMLTLSGVFGVWADIPVEYHASVTAQASSKSLAPYMLGSWNYGRYAEGDGIWQEAGLSKTLDMKRRFSWSVGFDYLAGVGSKTDYARWDDKSETWGVNGARRNAFRIQQLFGQLKYRAAFLTIGMRESHSLIVDDRLSSGDITRSNNASPIPGVAVGFVDFVDIPFTNGWVQINGELMYGRMMDSRFKEREFNLYYGIEALRLWYNYKRCYFRTNPDKPFHIVIGMQASAFFGGVMNKYSRGSLVSSEVRHVGIKEFLQAFIPQEGGEDYYEGGHLGSWDFKATYRLKDGSRLSAYFEWPWEDGSGIGRMNGWDGVWGLQYDFADKGIVTKAAVEYLDFTNQSGPIHYAPADNPESNMTGQAQGADNYYNNDYYGSYTNYGMGIGTPFLVAPIYNLNGSLDYLHNRARGFHVAIEGNPTDRISYRVMAGYSKAGGSGRVPAYRKVHASSAMVEGSWRPSEKIPCLEIGLRVAFDKGELRGDNFGAQLRIGYTGEFNIKGKGR